MLVNFARGSIVDTAALVVALEDNKIDAAILDVFETEPLSENSPLWSPPRVILSAHCTAFGLGLAERGDALLRWEVSPSNKVRENMVGQSITVSEKVS